MTNTKVIPAAELNRPTRSRNGLIDLYRFLLSLVVVKSHSLFIYQGAYFGPGRACVEFFFVLSGYLFWSFLNKCKNESIKDSIIRLHKTRFIPLAIPICIGVLSNILEFFITHKFNMWQYLWYIEVMFIEMIALILLRKLIKSDRTFLLTIAGIMLVALGLKFFGPLYSFGYVRGASSIPMGIILAALPKIKKQWISWLGVVFTFSACFAIICFGWADVLWLGYNIPELILDNILYPALIYFSFSVKFESKIFSYLGGLSFGLYAFQCTADLVRNAGVNDVWILFGIILFATLAEDFAKRIYRRYKKKQEN